MFAKVIHLVRIPSKNDLDTQGHNSNIPAKWIWTFPPSPRWSWIEQNKDTPFNFYCSFVILFRLLQMTEG